LGTASLDDGLGAFVNLANGRQRAGREFLELGVFRRRKANLLLVVLA